MAAWHDRDVKAGTLVLLVYFGLACGLVGTILWRLWTEVLAAWPT